MHQCWCSLHHRLLTCFRFLFQPSFVTRITRMYPILVSPQTSKVCSLVSSLVFRFCFSPFVRALTDSHLIYSRSALDLSGQTYDVPDLNDLPGSSCAPRWKTNSPHNLGQCLESVLHRSCTTSHDVRLGSTAARTGTRSVRDV